MRVQYGKDNCTITAKGKEDNVTRNDNLMRAWGEITFLTRPTAFLSM